jgi:hypothetical protein
VELGIVVERTRRPGAFEDALGVDQALDALLAGDAERLELPGVRADGEPEGEPTVREQIDGRRVLREPDAVVQRRERDARPDLDLVGFGGERAQRGHRRREVAVLPEVVLRDPRAVQARGLDLPGEGAHLVVDLRHRAVVVRAALTGEQPRTQLHASPWRSQRDRTLPSRPDARVGQGGDGRVRPTSVTGIGFYPARGELFTITKGAAPPREV